MKHLTITILVGLVFALMGCGNDSGSGKAVSHGGTDRTLRGGVSANNGADGFTEAFYVEDSAIGYIYEANWNGNNSNFQSRVNDFLFPILDQNQIGQVSGDFYSEGSGIHFSGKGIKLNQNQNSLPYGTNGFSRREGVFNTESSELRIVVNDSFVESGDEYYTVIPVHFNDSTTDRRSGGLTGSLVDQGLIQLIFEDELGKVSLEGYLQDEYYIGQVLYKNLQKVRVNNSGERQLSRVNDQSAKVLGRFAVKACEFFDVRQIGNLTCHN